MSRQPVEAGNFGIGSGSAAAGFQVMEKRRIQADGSDAHLFFRLRPGAYEGDSHIAFLTDLHRFEGGRHGAPPRPIARATMRSVERVARWEVASRAASASG